MGKKSGRHSSSNSNAGGADAPKATAFVLKVPTHCQCNGCADKIRAAVKDLTLRCEGILSLDQSALGTKGELAVVATADPETLRRRLRKATGKSVDLVFPKPPADRAAVAADGKDDAAAAAVQALLLASLQQQPMHAHHGQPMPAAAAWNALQGRYGQAYAYACPWVVQQQQQQVPPLQPYLAAYPVASWGAYAAYPHDDGLGGAYGGDGGWPGY